VDVLHQSTLLGLHQKVSPRDQVVGWFSTGDAVTGIDVILQSFYRDQGCANPVHLTLDTDLLSAGPSVVKTYVSRAVSIREFAATEFAEIPNEVRPVSGALSWGRYGCIPIRCLAPISFRKGFSLFLLTIKV
jgi:translation initiation factor 3 subunit F